MTEQEFIAAIDCQFPYAQTQRAVELIDQAMAISPNAVFAVVDEIARVPRGIEITRQQRQSLLSEVESRLEHPLKDLIIGIARRMVDDQWVPVPEAVAAMRQVGSFRNEHAALSVAYFSCDDTNGEADNVYNDVVRVWQTR